MQGSTQQLQVVPDCNIPFEGATRPVSHPARTELMMRELAQLQAQAARLAMAIEAAEPVADTGPDAPQACTEEHVRAILKGRLDRNGFFPPHLFADPAWDMLLDLYAAHLGQRRVSVTSLCIAANVPTTTALRWISTLEGEGLIERRADPLDGRRFFISLTGEAIRSFEQFFAGSPGQVAPL